MTHQSSFLAGWEKYNPHDLAHMSRFEAILLSPYTFCIAHRFPKRHVKSLHQFNLSVFLDYSTRFFLYEVYIYIHYMYFTVSEHDTWNLKHQTNNIA